MRPHVTIHTQHNIHTCHTHTPDILVRRSMRAVRQDEAQKTIFPEEMTHSDAQRPKIRNRKREKDGGR